jgi:hypothetical protein
MADKKIIRYFIEKANEIINKKDFVPASYIVVNYTPKKK